jgi:DNA-binding response OmpR family regulator
MGNDYLGMAAKLGADAIIEKPVRMQQLLNLVSEVLARNRSVQSDP